MITFAIERSLSEYLRKQLMFFQGLGMLRLQCLDFQPDQFVKTHIQNGICLILRKMQFCLQLFQMPVRKRIPSVMPFQ